MAEAYNALAGTQTEINRRLLRMIEELQDSSYDDTEIKQDIDELKEAIGDESTANSIPGRIKALEDA